ncbi:multiple resistance and pH regulation protein F [Xanthobacter autotrophicus]|uniref:monovalent cation/H+ antiporter complex subunit F n=1 Tax=Xanthobacter TaxID=279 RepID=UPI0024AA520C|nr:monovalent cation/H+ antiporter complex subunit F [Xanthobacter autotrophicus]MDI4664926.1 multiple resistance and pH regulation protein F [Xanthobacter autotrophicus]
MADLLFAAATLLLLLTAAGLAALWRAGNDADRMLAIQLLGSAGIAILLLVAPATGDASILDTALLLALLAALAACAYRAAFGPTRSKEGMSPKAGAPPAAPWP